MLTTLSAMLTQILIFSKDVDDKPMFLRHARADEISAVLRNYFSSYDITNCIKLLRIREGGYPSYKKEICDKTISKIQRLDITPAKSPLPKNKNSS